MTMGERADVLLVRLQLAGVSRSLLLGYREAFESVFAWGSDNMEAEFLGLERMAEARIDQLLRQ